MKPSSLEQTEEAAVLRRMAKCLEGMDEMLHETKTMVFDLLTRHDDRMDALDRIRESGDS